MFNFRVIPILTINEGRLVKTFNFDKKSYVGDPINTVKIFNNKYVDELIILDISKSVLNLDPDFEYIKSICSECFSPITYGGGVRKIDHCEKLFELGVEKIVFNNVLFEDFNFLKEFVKIFGSQSMILSLNIYYKNNDYFIYDYRKKVITEKKLKNYFKEILKINPGEILLYSVDRDGCNQGLDFNILENLENTSNIPLILAGGLSNYEQVLTAKKRNLDAVAGSYFFTMHGKFNSILISYLNSEQIEKIRE
tara:strand:- start:383 stop:1138 length:756 start_codon:yes stop_codon:yes gene_type:complete